MILLKNSLLVQKASNFIVAQFKVFYNYMKSNGVECSPLHLRNDRHSIFEDGSHLSGLKSFYSNFIHWGCGWWISEKDRAYIVDLIKKGW